jgi:hypothetical protein
LTVLPGKVCREDKQDVQNKRIVMRKREQFSWQCYGSEIAEVANLSGEAQLSEG